MQIAVVGVNHNTAPIELRELLAFSEKDMDRAYKEFIDGIGKDNEKNEVLILSTCNRTEIYGYVEDGDMGIDLLKRFLVAFHHLDEYGIGAISQYLYSYSEWDTVKHVYMVASGLDSMVIGEDQILGQVKQAHRKAMDAKASGPVLNTLFRYAVTAAKKIKTDHALSDMPLSISSIAIKFIKEKFGDISEKRFFVLGLGKMGVITMKNLVDEGIKNVYVANRTYHKATKLKEKIPGITVIPYEKKMEVLSTCDIVISCTSAPHYIIKRENFMNYYNGDHPICFVDLSLPRDIDPSVKELSNVTLYCIDDLRLVSEENRKKRMTEANKIKEVVNNEAEKFWEWYLCIGIYPVINEMKRYYRSVIDKEMKSLMKGLGHLSEEDKSKLQIKYRLLAKKLFRMPMMRMKKAALKGQGDIYRDVVSDLFGIEDL